MYCFSRICRICLTSNKTDLQNLNNPDTDNIKINDKLVFCIPEISNPYNNLPETICGDCYQFIQRMYVFKQTSIENTIKLNRYASKLSNIPGVFNKNNLTVTLEKDSKIDELLISSNIKTETTDSSAEFDGNQIQFEDETDPQLELKASPRLEILISPQLELKASPQLEIQTSPQLEIQPTLKLEIEETPLLELKDSLKSEEQISPQTEIQTDPHSEVETSPHSKSETFNNSSNHSHSLSADTTSKEVSMYSVSLNKWDLFETKYTCRCIKEFSSFTENTTHLCKNCEGELLGFRLSKIKASTVENRINANVPTIKYENESNESFDESDLTDFEYNESNECERGFDDNDVLLCKMHINGVNKQIDELEDNLSHNDTKTESSFIRHTCPICKKAFSTRYYLNKHFLSHSGNKIYEFTDKNNLEKHKLKNYEAAKRMHFLTPTTSKSLPIDDQSDSEEEEHHLSKSAENSELNSSGEIAACGTCDKIFESKGKLAIHLMTHVGKKEYKCSTCHQKFSKKENFDLHLKKHHKMSSSTSEDLMYKCPYCNKAKISIHYLRRHIRETHVIRSYVCVICDQSYDDRRKLERHIFIKHTLHDDEHNDKKYICPYCDRTFSKISYLRKHMREVHDIKTHICPICDEVCNDKEILDEHIFDAHAVKENDVETESEQKIEKEFKQKVQSEFKQKVQSEFKQNVEKGSKRKVNIEYIKIISEGVKKYKCPYCDKSYFHATNVRRHLNQCQEKIKYDEEQNQSNINTFSCPICGKKFNNLANIRKHLRRVHGIKEHLCVICNEIFDEKQTLDEHVFIVHNMTNYEDDEQEMDDDDDEQEMDDNDDEQEMDDDHKKVDNSQTKENAKYKCTYCDKRYYYVSTVRRHIRDNHKVDDTYLCSICNKTFTEKQTLEEHIFSVHTQAENKNSPNEDKLKGYSCPVCHKHFLHLSNLRMHALSHPDELERSNELNYCKICKKNISRKSMSRHMRTHGKVLHCAACAAKFDNRWVLRQHMKSKHPNFVPIFKCNDCFKTYSSNYALKKHRRKHH